MNDYKIEYQDTEGNFGEDTYTANSRSEAVVEYHELHADRNIVAIQEIMWNTKGEG